MNNQNTKRHVIAFDIGETTFYYESEHKYTSNLNYAKLYKTKAASKYTVDEMKSVSGGIFCNSEQIKSLFDFVDNGSAYNLYDSTNIRVIDVNVTVTVCE